MRRQRRRSSSSKGLSKEVSPKGIRVVRVAPGWVETEPAVRMVNRLANTEGTDYQAARKGPDGFARWHSASIAGTEYVIDGGTVRTA